MSELSGNVVTLADVLAVAHRLESGAAHAYDALADAAAAQDAADVVKIWRGLAAAARRRARVFGPPPAPGENIAAAPAPLEGAPPTPWQAMDMALALEHGALTMLRMMACLAGDDQARDEAARLAERKREHMTELGQRQARHAQPTAACAQTGADSPA